MTKRFSFLSANPNYTVFLTNLAGLHAVYGNDSDTNLNDYWKEMLNRVPGDQTENGLWNKYNATQTKTNAQLLSGISVNFRKSKGSEIPWMRSSSD